jgi:hypothetical protein
MKTEITRSLLVQKYLVEGKGSPTIAKETGWTKPYILKKLREFKIPRRKLSEYYEDLSGKKIGKLTVIEPVVSKNTRSARTWKCQCDCGNFCEVDSDKIKRRKKIGCYTCGWWNGIPRNVWASFRYSTRGHEINVSDKYVQQLFDRQNGRCALTGRELYFARGEYEKHLTTASLDRIDSDIGYVEGNLQWVHKDVNFMKHCFSQEYFIQTCKEIAEWAK